MNIKKRKKEVEYFEVETKCGKKIKSNSKKLLKHNIELHELYCKECKNVKKQS